MTDAQQRQQIADLICEYVHCIDDDRLEQWPDFFTADCVYKIIARENYDQGLPVGLFYCDSRGMLADRVYALREANVYEPHRYRHMVSATRFLPAQNGAHPLHTNFQVVRIMENGAFDLYATGKYVDQVVFEQERPLFKERMVVLDSARVDTLLVLPL